MQPKRIWDNTHEIGEVQISEKVKSVVNASIRDGIKYLNIRHWYQKKDGTWGPSMDGVCMAVNPYKKDGEQIPDPTDDFISLLGLARTELEAMPLYDEANAVYAKPKVK